MASDLEFSMEKSMSYKTPHTVARARLKAALAGGDEAAIEAARQNLYEHPPESMFDVLEYVHELDDEQDKKFKRIVNWMVGIAVVAALCLAAYYL